MKKLLVLSSTALVAVFAFHVNSYASPIADEERVEAPESHGHAHGLRGYKLFERMDVNNDGFLTLEEVEHDSKTHHFDLMDANEDDVLSLEEVIASGRTKEIFEKIDSNQDGSITFEESIVIEQTRFTDADENADGKVSWQEYKNHYDRKNG